MTARDFLICLAMVAVGIGVLASCAELDRRGDIERRLTKAHLTLFPHLAALAIEVLHHLRQLTTGRARSHHCEQAFVAFVALLILVVPPILMAHAAESSQLARHGMPLTLGTIVWSAVVEVPELLPRMPQLTQMTGPLSALTVILIVLMLDLAVILLAASGAIQGAEAQVFGCGAAFVAVADIFSALLSLVRAAFDP